MRLGSVVLGLGVAVSAIFMAADGHGQGVPVSRIKRAVASSVLPQSKAATYAAANVVDGNQSTAWVEGVPGTGVGQWIAIYLGDAAQLHGLRRVSGTVHAGYQKNTASYQNNSRPSLIRLELFTDSRPLGTTSVPVQDAITGRTSATAFSISVPACPARGTLWLRTTIAGAQAGRKWEDTGISEIRCDLEGCDPYGAREALQPFARAVQAQNRSTIAAFTTIAPQTVLNAFTNENTETTGCDLDGLRVASDLAIEVCAACDGEGADYYARFIHDGRNWKLVGFDWWQRTGCAAR